MTTRREEVNGQPGALFLDREGRLIGVMILDVADGQIQGVSSVVNPDKLRHLGPVGDCARCCANGASGPGSVPFRTRRLRTCHVTRARAHFSVALSARGH